MLFKLARLTQASPDIVTAALGVNAAGALNGNDLEKAVKLAANNNYVMCSLGNDIEGTVASINPDTVNNGFALGSVDKAGRRSAIVDAAQVGSIAVGALVVAGTQATVNAAGGLVVTSGTPTLINWRLISITSGTGVAGDTVVIEKV